MIQTWRLDCLHHTFVLAARSGRMAEVVYWGPPLPASEDLTTLSEAAEGDVTGGMLDTNPPLSICPKASRNFPGQAGIKIRTNDGTPLRPKFAFDKAEERPQSLTLHYTDDALSLRYVASFHVDAETQMLVAQSKLVAAAPILLDWLSAPVFPALQLSDEMLDFSGRWCAEFQMIRTPWSIGARLRENPTGRTGHEHFPALLVPERGATNTQGEVMGFHYGWSGGHRMVAEELPDGRRQVQFGHATGMHRTPGTAFETAPLYVTYSTTGLNGCATAFQRHLRDRIVPWPNPDRPRPVHYNCWEAVYFNHSLSELKDLAARAAVLGAERFVLDDGWFGTRDDDTQALGDWLIDARKYPDGLGPLIDHIHGLGMTFGIWFEPEMVNPNSDLYRAHPDWVLGDADQSLGRQQLVLDMANDNVTNYLFDRMSDVLSAYDIDYIKWDHNRVLPLSDAAQTHGTYALLDRLRAAFPKLEIESCASGGGRIDFGILSRTHRVWLSDSNDALERLRMQHNAALFLPAAVTGSHVGPRVCHTSGRTLDIRFRAWVAAQRHMGFEMNPTELTHDEAEVLRNVTTWWKANRNWMSQADILRLDAADEVIVAEQQMAKDAAHFVVFAGKAATSRQIAPRPLRLTNLESDTMYRIDLLNRDDAHHLSRSTPLLKSGPATLSGRYLMHRGITLPWSFPETMWVIEGTAL